MPERPRRIGLTGGIGTGKSVVLRHLAAHGVPTLDTDDVARAAVRRGGAAFDAVVSAFGLAVVGADGEIDRPALARLVFADESARRRLEQIVHPVVWQAVEAFLAGAAGPAVVAVPLLYETGAESRFDRVLVTDCPEETQVARVMARDGVGEASVRARLAAQVGRDERRARADAVISTAGSYDETFKALSGVWSSWGLGPLAPAIQA